MVQEQADLIRTRVQLRQAFTPDAPISHKDSLQGRSKQISQVIEAVADAGKHAIVFGERGVGKTSLAGLIHDFWIDFIKEHGFITARVNCEPLDDYASIWSHVAEEILEGYKEDKLKPDFRVLLEELDIGDATPNLVRRCFQACDDICVIIIDEFDRIPDTETIQRFADTIKGLSDYNVNATLVLVGVADTIDELIGNHASIDRNLIQIFVPRLKAEDIQGIVASRLTQVNMSTDSLVLGYVSFLSQGLPYYAHLLGLTSGLAAVDDGQSHVTMVHLVSGLRVAIENALETIRAAYYQATASTKKESLYRHVLLACAITPVDELGYFAAGDVREPLSKVLGEQVVDIAKYLRHLSEFCSEGRGGILQSSGPQWKKRYRFKDPLLRPYALLKGLEEGRLKPEQLR